MPGRQTGGKRNSPRRRGEIYPIFSEAVPWVRRLLLSARVSTSRLAKSVRPLRVFVVEDDEFSLSWLLLYLEAKGHVAAAAKTRAEALELYARDTFDLLISDLNLPDGDGWELLSKLRAIRPIYAVMISGHGTDAHRARSKAAGFRHHLLKGGPLCELDAVLAEAARETTPRPEALLVGNGI